MGLDVGKKRIGIAVSDPLGLTAQAKEVWERRGEKSDLAHLVALIEECDVEEVVVGHPLRTDGTPGPEARDAEAFAGRLAEAAPGVRVTLWDERFTTQEAHRALGSAGLSEKRRRRLVDMTAAQLILQGYMQRRKGGMQS